MRHNTAASAIPLKKVILVVEDIERAMTVSSSKSLGKFLVLLAAFASYAIVVSYRSICSYENWEAGMAEISFLHPVPEPRYEGIITEPEEYHDAPVSVQYALGVYYYDDDEIKGEIDEFGEEYDEIDAAQVLENDRDDADGSGDKTVVATAKHMTQGQKDGTSRMSQRLREFVPEPPPPAVLKKSIQRQSQIDFDAIATAWKLPDGSVDLLQQIQSRTVAFDYNRTTDILALRHPLKTGGTSISVMLRDIYGKDRVIPGSGPSNWWNRGKFEKAVEEHSDDPSYWDNMAVLYTHSLLRRSPSSKLFTLDKMRKKAPQLAQKRIRLMSIVRNPLDWAASGFYETQCRIGNFAKQKNLNGAPCPPVNLTDVMVQNIRHWTNKCEKSGWKRGICSELRDQGGETVFGHCGSVDYLLDKTDNVHNLMHKSMMGEFPRPPELGDGEFEGSDNLTPTLKDVSLYTLRDLGGLIDFNPTHKEDFVWFAITERFSESMCLFYYHFEIPPVEEKTSL